MRKSAIYWSLVFHLAVVVLTMVSMPFLKRDFVIPAPITVEFAEIDKIAQTPKVAPRPTPKQEETKDTPPAPPEKAPPKPEPAPPSPAPDEKKEPPPPKDAAPPPPDKKTPPKKEEKKKEKKEEKKEPARDFSSVLKNLAPAKDPATPAEDAPDMKTDENAAPAEGQNAPLGARLTISEEDALRRQLERCWNVPFGAKDAQNIVVEIRLTINPDRTLRDARIIDQSRYNSDSFFRAMADSAIRAVRNPQCSPFQLPPDKYDMWKQTTVSFNPSQMF